MNVQTRAKIKGFTIIEVVLVLAIAALIFLMVFIALPALQAGQRDTARKQDVGTVASQITNYTSNNRGSFPTAGTYAVTGTTTGFAGYINGKLSTNTSSVIVHAAGTTTTTGNASGVILVTPGTSCGTGFSGTLTRATSAAAFTVVTTLEQGGAFCQDS